MRLAGVLFLGLLCLNAVMADEVVDEKDVIVLGEKNFTEVLGKHKYALVRGAPHCDTPTALLVISYLHCS